MIKANKFEVLIDFMTLSATEYCNVKLEWNSEINACKCV